MAKLKTTPNDGNVFDFLNSVEDDIKREDCFTLLELMQKLTKAKPKMWGGSIVGFGSYHYKYESGREGDWFLTGFSPRKQALTLYIMSGFEKEPELMQQLGKYKTGKSCLYIKKLKDVDTKVLKQVVKHSVNYLTKNYPTTR